jgi:hypothetical protein
MKKSEQNKRTHVIKVRYNDEEYEKIQKISEMPVAKYIRLKSLEKPLERHIYPPKVDKSLIREVNSIGVNLNQLTTIANSNFNNNTLDNLALASELAFIRHQLDQLLDRFSAKENISSIDEIIQSNL